MRWWWHYTVVLLCFSVSITLVRSANLLSGPKCRDLTCKFLEYCSKFDSRCQPCSDVCSTTTHNFDETICREDCQDFLRDQRYLNSNGSGGANNGNLRETVQSLSHMVTVVLTLVCFMLIVLTGLLCFLLYRWKQKKNITITTIKNKLFSKKPERNATKPNNPDSKPDIKQLPELRLDMGTTTIGSHSDHSPVTVTTSISRKPAEDSALDYSYDNPAMSGSPT